ncbi:MAG: ABC transporter ATP-binding protein [Acidimicrobiales bacterium]
MSIDTASSSHTQQPDATTPQATDEAEPEMAIRVQNVSKVFELRGDAGTGVRGALTGFHRAKRKEFWAVNDVSVDVPRGSMLGIIGRNGSGKSTLLRTMCGVYAPSKGRIEVRGRITALLELGAGFHADLTGRENIFMNAAVMGIPRSRAEAIVPDVENLADIGEFFDNPVDTYSSGMRARLGFAVSVHLEPDILLADEIISVGDISFSKNGLQHMERMRGEGVTIVLVAHGLAIMERLCDQVLWLHEGRPQMLGEPREIVREYRDFMTMGEAALPTEDADDSNPITHVEVSSDDGIPFGYTGAPLSIHAAYDLAEPVDDAYLTIRFQAQETDVFLGSTSAALNQRLEGRGTVDVGIPILPIPPGQYAVEFQITEGSGRNARIVAKRMARLPVRPLEEIQIHDFVDINADWRIK